MYNAKLPEMNQKKVKSLLNGLTWDYHITPVELYQLAAGTMKERGWFTREWALIRILSRLSWYDILSLFGVKEVKKILSSGIIKRIQDPSLRKQYEILCAILHKTPVPFSGWNTETRRSYESAFLSHRWYRTLPALL